MKLTVLDVAIIEDALSGSLRIADGGNIFRFSIEARKNLAEKILTQMDEQELPVKEET